MRKTSFVLLAVAAACCTGAGAVELTHRWSFNAANDYTDSVGGVVATKMGTALQIADGQVKLTGTAAKSGSLDLGANLLDADGATIEIWATQNTVRDSSRIFDYGTDSTHYFMLNWTYGTSTYQSWAMALTPNAVTNVYTPTGPYLLGTPYHFAVTFAKSGTKTYVRWTKRLAQTGGLPIAHDITTKEALSTFSNPHLYLGASHASGVDANASYDEVRIWKGVLSDEQLAANAIAGPDAVATNGVSAQGSTGFAIAPGTRFVIGSSAEGSFLRSDITGRFLTDGTVTIGSGAKIVFDTSEHRVPTLSFKAAGFTLPADAPAGATVLDYVEVTDTVNYGAPTLSGNTITVSLASGMPATAYWTGGRPTSGDDLASAANWKCYDAAGNLMNGAVPSAATTIVITNATTAFTVPNGVTPAWHRIRLGAERTVSQWGKKRYGTDRYSSYGMYGTQWMIPLSDYVCNGTLSDPSVIPQGVLEKSQLRMDGWFYVAAANAGNWKIYQNVTFDDYSALAIDGEWVFHDIGYRFKLSSYCNVAEGWHRYTVIVGDTFGGYTGKSSAGNLNYYVTRPKSGGGTENVQFKPTSFTFGSEAPSTIKLTDDCNWGAFGVISLSNGTVLDLNGHDLVVQDVDSDYIGSMITNTYTSMSTLYTAVNAYESGISNLHVSANVFVTRSSAYIWTGNGGDAKFSTLDNWQLVNGVTPSVAPAAGDALVFTGAGGVVSNDLSNIGQASVTFRSGAGAFTICGNPFTGVEKVINDSSQTQTFSNAVTFAGVYSVSVPSAAIRFPGGATATYPDPALRSEFGSVERYRTLYGNFTFTENWSVPNMSSNKDYPWVVPSGTSVSGKKFTGAQGSFVRTLRIDAGGRAHFTEMEMGWSRGDFDCKGTLVVDGLYVHLVSGSASNTGVSHIGRPGSTGTLYANKIEKRYYSYLCEYVTTLVVGSGGIRFTENSYHPLTFYADTTIRAADDFGILTDFAGDGTDFHGLSLSNRTITVNTEDESGIAHTVTFGTSVRAEGGVLRKIGSGTLVMQDGDLVSKTNFVKRYTGGTVVEAGTLCVKSSNQLGSGPVTLHPGATLEITDGVTFANDVVRAQQGGGTIRVSGAVTLDGGASWHAGGYDFAEGAVVTVAPRATDGVIASGLTPADTNHFTTAAGRLVLSDTGELTVADTFVWIGPDGGNWSNAANWSHNGVVGDAAPISVPSAFVEFANDAALSVVLDTPAACCRLVFGGAGAVTVANPDAATTNTLTVYRVIGTGSAANRLECKVNFTEAYNVNLNGALDFAGGATATTPGSDTFANVHNRTLTGNVVFTNSWKFPNQTGGAPIVVTSGSTLTGTSYKGAQMGWYLILNINADATAIFNSFECGWDRGFVCVNGELDVTGDCTIVASWSPTGASNHLGWYSDKGLVRTGGLVKLGMARTLLYTPHYEIGAGGVRSTANECFVVTNGRPVSVTATADMGFYKGTNRSAQVVNVYKDVALTLDLGGHTVTNVNLVGGGGTLAITGTGTARYDAVGGPAAISVGSDATLQIGANVVATNAMALADGAVLVLGTGAQAGIVSTPAAGAATVRTTGTYNSPQSVPLGKLAANANVKRLALDPAGITIPQGYRAFLKRSGDNLFLRIDKLGATIIIR